MMESPRATSTTPANPLSRWVRTSASIRAGDCAPHGIAAQARASHRKPLVIRLQQDYDRREYHCRDDCFHVDAARLSPNLAELARVQNRFGSLVHVALTARCEAYSRFFARLKETEGSSVEHQDQWQAPHKRCVHRNQKGRYQRSSGKPHDPEDHPFALLTRANIRDLLSSRSHMISSTGS